MADRAAALETRRFAFLPAIGSRAYYVLLALVAIFVLGPLGGVAAAYMNFSLGFFIGGQGLAGILGSPVTLGYGAEGPPGADYMQSMAGAGAGLAGGGGVLQTEDWVRPPRAPAG